MRLLGQFLVAAGGCARTTGPGLDLVGDPFVDAFHCIADRFLLCTEHLKPPRTPEGQRNGAGQEAADEGNQLQGED